MLLKFIFHQVRIDSTARTIVNEACTKLDLDPKTFDLCEVKSSGEKNPLDNNDISVYSAISVNGRLYIVPKSHSEKTLVQYIYMIIVHVHVWWYGHVRLAYYEWNIFPL